MEINLFRVKYIVSQMAFYVITFFFGENRDNHLGNSRFSVPLCFSGNEPAVTSNASTLGLRVTLTSSILMERAERNLLKSSVT